MKVVFLHLGFSLFYRYNILDGLRNNICSMAKKCYSKGIIINATIFPCRKCEPDG